VSAVDAHTPTAIVNDQDVIKNIEFHVKIIENEVLCIPDIYKPEEISERGRSYVIIRAIDTRDGQNVAIKKRARVFPTATAEEMLGDQKYDPNMIRVPKRVLREVWLLFYLLNVLDASLDSFKPSSYR
jgi:hypothetical protein